MKKLFLIALVMLAVPSFAQAAKLTPGYVIKFDGGIYTADSSIYNNGVNVGIGSTVPRAKLEVVGTVRATTFIGDASGMTGLPSTSQWTTNGTSIGTTGNVGVGSSAPSQKVDVIGTVKATAFVGDGTGITGLSGSISGLTSGKLPKATSATTIGDGQIYDNGTNIGIGTTVPIAKLSVAGDLYLNGGAYIYGTGSGNIGIGSLTPAAALDISGAGSKIRMLSPDSSIYNCGPANGGTWTCS